MLLSQEYLQSMVVETLEPRVDIVVLCDQLDELSGRFIVSHALSEIGLYVPKPLGPISVRLPVAIKTLIC